MTAQIVLPSGNVGKEIEDFTFGQDGRGVKFSVVVTDFHRGEELKQWYQVACFGRLVDTVNELRQTGKLTTGSKVLVMGSFKPREYAGRDGGTRMSLDITANYLEVISSPRAQQSAPNTDDWEYADDDDDSEPGF